MAVLTIRLEGDPVLRQRAKPVDRITKKTQRLLKDMADTMYAAQGIGLAAPQVGVLERLIVVDIGEGLISMVNPRIISASGSDVDVEGCLSMPGLRGYVERAETVVVEGLDEKGKPLRIEASGLLARVFQHEIDHLDGILFTDKATGLYYLAPEQGDGDEEGSDEAASEGNGKATEPEGEEERP